MERRYWDKRFHRERCVDPEFHLSPDIKKELREWITADNWPTPDRIRISEDKTDVIVSWHKSTVPQFRVHCRMPPVAYDLEDNPVYKALKKKVSQVKEAGDRRLRCIFLVDAGCDLLRRLRPMGVHEIGGGSIIQHALRKLSIDMVCVFSPYRKRQLVFAPESHLFWQVTFFDKREGMAESEYSNLQKLAAQLPHPRFEGYQARDLHRQGAFDPSKHGWYLGTHVTTRGAGQMTIKVSARLVQEYMAGRMNAETFRQQAFGNERNYFEMELAHGHTIRDVRFESAGLDEDDDYVEFDLDFDWSVASLKSLKPVQS